MARIMEAADVGDGDFVLEVGPGTGALTERLLETGATVVANEIDTDLQAILEQRVTPMADGRFDLVIGDILQNKRTINPQVIDAVDRRRGGDPFKLIANLPYHIASPLLANLVADHPAMTDAVVMIQKEVADRLAAPPGGKAYGPLGIMIQALCDVRTVGVLPPSCFWPAPKVASAVVHLRRRDQPATDNPARLSALLQTLFTKRRKQLGAILGRSTPLPAGIRYEDRPELLTVEQLVELAEAVGGAGPDGGAAGH